MTSASILHAGTYTGTISVSVQVLVAQASTIKEISSNVNSARFAKSVSLSVQVSGVDPSRTVQFFNGTTSLGTAALSTSPSGGNSLKLATLTLTSLPVGSLNLTSRYPGDTNNAASTSQILAQSVIAADTKVTVSPASNPVSIGSSKFNISVQAVALGGGVPPQGSVTMSAGAVNCVASLTAGSGSCSVNLAAAGFAGITGSYAPTGSNHIASIGGLGVVVVPTPSSTDLRVRIGNGARNITHANGKDHCKDADDRSGSRQQ